jgi:hypothetical protein
MAVLVPVCKAPHDSPLKVVMKRSHLPDRLRGVLQFKAVKHCVACGFGHWALVTSVPTKSNCGGGQTRVSSPEVRLYDIRDVVEPYVALHKLDKSIVAHV